MQLRRTIRQLAAAAVLLYAAAAGGELLAARLFDQHPSSAIPEPTTSLDAGTTALPDVPTAAAVAPRPAPSAQGRVAVNPHCPAYAIPTTGHRPELTKLLEQLVHGAKVKGSRVHLFVDMTALVADHKLLSSLQKSFGVHVHHRSKQVQDKQEATRPARPWPPASKKAEERAGAAQTGDIDMAKAVGLWYHYAFMLETMFGAGQNSVNTQPESALPFGTEYVAILEDDLSVSVDLDEYVLRAVRMLAMRALNVGLVHMTHFAERLGSYFCRMTHAMAADDSIFSVSSHNDAGFWPTSSVSN